MIDACICTIGDEILIGQVVDTNSSQLALALEAAGIHVKRMISMGDDKTEIATILSRELSQNALVISTGGLGPTKDDITKAVLGEISGAKGMVTHPGQLEMVHKILPPIMVFRNVRGGGTLYALPGVPHEAVGAIPAVMDDICSHQPLDSIQHRNIMVYGIAESALSEKIAPWEDALPADMHLAYLPNPLTGIRLRLSTYGGNAQEQERRMEQQLTQLKALLGPLVYASKDTDLETTVGELLKAAGKTLSAAESCTGGEIAHLITSVPGSSAYFLGSVTSYAISVKETVLGVSPSVIREKGVVSSEVAAAMAEGVRRLTGSDYAVSTTGLAGPAGDAFNPVGTVWIGVAGPKGTRTVRYCYKNDRKRNIERFAASALNFLRLTLQEEL